MKSMTAAITLVVAFSYALANELEFRTYEDLFTACMNSESPTTDAEIVDQIRICEDRTGYHLDEDYYP